MNIDAIQNHCEKLEELLEIECKKARLTNGEFNTINNLLFELQSSGLYKLPEKYNVKF